MIDPERGGEVSALACARTGQVVSATVAGAAIGAMAGAFSTQVKPVSITLDKDVQVAASFAPHEHGLVVRNDQDELGLPYAPVSTSIPGFGGVKLELKGGKVVQEVTQAINTQQSIKKFTKLAAQPQVGVVDPIKDGLTGRVIEGSVAGVIILPILGAVALRRYGALGRLKNVFSGRKKYVVLPAGLAALAGCGYSGDQIIQNMNDAGHPLPASITSRSPYLKDASIKGEDLSEAVDKIVARLDKGRNEWTLINSNLSAKLGNFERNGGLSYKFGSDVETELNETGVLCNGPYTDTILPTLVRTLQPSYFIDTGDRQTNGKKWPFENGCEKQIIRSIGPIPRLFIKGNHDQAAPKQAVSVSLINGVKHVSYPDPRSTRWGTSKPPLSQAELERELAIQGSAVAETACDILDKTGVAPDVDVHTPEAAFETILRGCANNVSSGHGIRHNDDKNTTHPIFRSYVSLTGRLVQSLINVTASGSVDNRSIYKGPGKAGAVVLREFRKRDHAFNGAISIVFNKDRSVEIKQIVKPAPIEPTAYMRSLVINNSPTAKKVIDLG